MVELLLLIIVICLLWGAGAAKAFIVWVLAGVAALIFLALMVA